MAITDLPHPEKREGEVFLTNDFTGFVPGWKTTRPGNVAYDKYGDPIQAFGKVTPYFAKRDELEAAGITIVDAGWSPRPTKPATVDAQAKEPSAGFGR